MPFHRLRVGSLAIRAVIAMSISLAGAQTVDPLEPSRPSPTSAPATGPAAPPERLVQYYLKMYDRHLQSRDWTARAMAVVCLNQITDQRVTDRLFDLLGKDRSPVVRVYAWEALHSRLDLLDAKQKAAWLTAGIALARRGQIRGRLRLGLLRAIAAGGPTRANLAFFSWVFGQTNSLNPADIPTLALMRQIVTAWQHPGLVKSLILAMGRLDDAYRAEYLLRGLGQAVPSYANYKAAGAVAMWQRSQRDWANWYRQQKFRPVRPEQLKPYNGELSLLAPKQRIVSADDPRWKADLELGRFAINHFDIVLAIDATGSMEPVLQWVQRDVSKIMTALRVISREPRIGVTLYRDQGEAYIAKNIPLSGNVAVVGRAMSRESADGGGDVPEAVYAGLFAALKKQPWTKSEQARKVVILIGDAPPHPERIDAIQSLVSESAKEGFRIHTVKVRNSTRQDIKLDEFDKIAQWGQGHSTWSTFSVTALQETRETLYRNGKQAHPIMMGVVRAYGNNSGYQAILRSVIAQALSKAGQKYGERVQDFVNILLETVEEFVPEKRWPFQKTKEYVPGKGND